MPIITDLRWDSASTRFTFVYNQRGHQVHRVIAVNAASGATTTIVDEQSRTFIDYEGKQYLHHLEATSELIWMSERDGWNHLYLYDAAPGTLKNQITRGDWVVRGVDYVDETSRQIWFRAGGIRPGQDPYDVHYARVNLDGSQLVVLTEGAGTHAVNFSPNRRFFLDTWSRVDLPPITELRRAGDGARVCELERADATALWAIGWSAPERFVAKGRDGQTDIYGVIVRPMQFNPARRYPVIENIYAGPQSAYVPKSFRAYHEMQALAELGFNAGELIVRDMRRTKDAPYLPVAFIDDDPAKQKVMIHGIKVVGNRKDIPQIIRNLEVALAVIAMPSVPSKEIRDIVSYLHRRRDK